jgi:hypothetical protein
MKALAADPGRVCFRVLVAVSAVLVVTTLIFRFRTPYFLWLAPLNLTEENVAAAWFSGMLLLIGSLQAADGYFRLRSAHFRAALAWWVIAGMLMALSLDEIASLHERIEEWQTGPIRSFVPFLFVLLGGCAWSFLQLWLTPSERPKVVGLVVGFGLLVSVGGQEILERITYLPWYIRPFRFALEEGSELLAMLILIKTTMSNSAGLFERDRPARQPAFTGPATARWPVLTVAVLIAWPLADLTASLGDQAALGHFSDWLSCALFAFSAALLVRRWACAPVREPFPTSTVVLLAAASFICVQFDPIGDRHIFPASSTIDWLGLQLNTRLVLLALCSLGASESLRARGNGYRAAALSLVAVGAISALFSACSTPNALWWGYFASSAVATGAFASAAFALRSPATVAALSPSAGVR